VLSSNVRLHSRPLLHQHHRKSLIMLSVFVTLIYLGLLLEFLYRKSRNALPKRQSDPFGAIRCVGKRERHDSNSSTNSETPLKKKGRRFTSSSEEEGYSGDINRLTAANEEGAEGVKFGLTVFMICFTSLLIIIRYVSLTVPLKCEMLGLM
jgi:hypothetical protein